MRLSKLGSTFACLTLVATLLAPAGASAAPGSQRRTGSPDPGGTAVWRWVLQALGIPDPRKLASIRGRVAGDAEGLDQGWGIDPMGGQPSPVSGGQPAGSQELDAGAGIDPMGGGS